MPKAAETGMPLLIIRAMRLPMARFRAMPIRDDEILLMAKAADSGDEARHAISALARAIGRGRCSNYTDFMHA